MKKGQDIFLEGLFAGKGSQENVLQIGCKKDVNDYLSILAGLGNECLGAIQILDENSGK